MTWQHISTEVTVKNFEKCCISNAADGTDDNMLWNDNVDGDSVVLIGEGTENLTCFLYW